MLAWQIVSLVKLECVLSSPRQRPKSRIKRDANLDFSIATQFLFKQLKIAESAKIRKHERAYNLSVSSPIHVPKRAFLRKREVPPVPHILYLGLMYPKLSHIF